MYVAAFIPIFIILLSSEYRVNIEVEGGVEGAIYGGFIGSEVNIFNDFLGGIDGGGAAWLGGGIVGIIMGIIGGNRGLPALEFPPPGWA